MHFLMFFVFLVFFLGGNLGFWGGNHQPHDLELLRREVFNEKMHLNGKYLLSVGSILINSSLQRSVE